VRRGDYEDLPAVARSLPSIVRRPKARRSTARGTSSWETGQPWRVTVNVQSSDKSDRDPW